MKDDMAFEAIISNTVEKSENTEKAKINEKSKKIEKPEMPYFLKSRPAATSKQNAKASNAAADTKDISLSNEGGPKSAETNSREVKAETIDSGGERTTDSGEEGIIDGAKLKSDDEKKEQDKRKKALLNAISALNSEYFKLTKIQFGILRENIALQYRICKIDMEYSSEFDDFVAGPIGKKSAPLERKRQENEREYEAIEEKLKKIDGRIGELRAKLKEI